MNPYHEPTSKKVPTDTCDMETVITAEITLFERGMRNYKDYPLDRYAEWIKEKFEELFCDERLKDDDIKVQVFLHEKSEKDTERE